MLDRTKIALYLSVPAAIAAFLLLTMHGATVDDIRTGVRATATVGFAYFIAVYFARPLRDLIGVRTLLRVRRTLGLCVALAMSVHFLFLVWFFSVSEEKVFDDQLRFYTGGLGIVVLYVMAATSNNASVRALGPRWKQLHGFGIHYLWFFFAASYAIGLQKLGGAVGVRGYGMAAALLMLAAGLALRGYLLVRKQLAAESVTARKGAQR